VVTAGGRVLCVTALGDNVKVAQKRAYEVLDPISFDGMQCRRDIGFRAIKR
jgi:phosphoribosylamine--glycine ligase